MKNVLIPTDFSATSLDLVATVARAMPCNINIVLFHAFEMPDNLRDAMHLAGTSEHSALMTEALRLKCRKLKTAHSNISNISFRVMYGTTVHAFENYAEANDIDTIVWPEVYTFMPVLRNSVDPSRMFTRSGIELVRRFDGRKTATIPKTQTGKTDNTILRNTQIAH